MRNIYFTPGPSGLYYTVDQHIKEAIKTGVASISHRSKAFEQIYREAEENIEELLELPDNYKIVFTNSATEIWEKMVDSLISESSLHIVNGAFSNKFYQASTNLGKKADKLEAPWGELPDLYTTPNGRYDLVSLAHNETSTGVMTPLKDIYELGKHYQEAILAVDVVSSLPVVNLDYSQIDTAYASVQKAFGLPAGLGLWLVNDKTEEKARKVHESGKMRNSFHNILALLDQGKKHQTPSTPNILGIYLFAKVVRDMINRGIQQIRNDSIYKSTILYNLLEQHPSLNPFVEERKLRSETVIVIDSGSKTEEFISYLSNHKMIVGGGYGKMKGQHTRIANFPTHSKEQFEMLVDLIEKFE